MEKLRKIFRSRKGVILVMTLSVMGAIFAFAASMLLAATSTTGVVQSQYESAQAAMYARSLGQTLEAELSRAGSELTVQADDLGPGGSLTLQAAVSDENPDMECVLVKSADGQQLTVSIVSRYLKEESRLTLRLTRQGTVWGQALYLPEGADE